MVQLVFVILAFSLILVLTILEKNVGFLDSCLEVTSGFRSLLDIELPSTYIVSEKGQETI